MKKEGGHKYDDMIHLPHHVSKRHPQIPLRNRAAQFSPFAALTGHNETTLETGRLTDSYKELDEDSKKYLDGQLQMIQENLDLHPECEITYFQPDGKKDGGSYLTVHRRIKKIDAYGRQIVFTDGTAIPVGHLFPYRESCSGTWNCQTCRRDRRHSWAK